MPISKRGVVTMSLDRPSCKWELLCDCENCQIDQQATLILTLAALSEGWKR